MNNQKSDYSKKLLDPRWQKKRLEILTRDEWRCYNCGDHENTLHVHHKVYIKGAEPWDIPNDCLITLCEGCHLSETEFLPGSIEALNHAIKKHFLSSSIIDIAAGFYDIEMLHGDDVVASALNYWLKNKECMKLILEAYFDHLSKKRGIETDQDDNLPF